MKCRGEKYFALTFFYGIRRINPLFAENFSVIMMIIRRKCLFLQKIWNYVFA